MGGELFEVVLSRTCKSLFPGPESPGSSRLRPDTVGYSTGYWKCSAVSGLYATDHQRDYARSKNQGALRPLTRQPGQEARHDDPAGSGQRQKQEELQAKENMAKPNPKGKPDGQVAPR